MLRSINSLRQQPRFNVLVIGSGIVGASVTYACARRGWSTLVVDKGDLAGATSAGSTGLLHGGARYAEDLQLGMVYDAIRGREAFKRAAPHLVREINYGIPAYEGGKHGYRKMQLGRWLYDSTRLLGVSSFPYGQTLEAAQLREQGFLFDHPNLKGASFFWDGQTNDHRLALALLQTAAQLKAQVINHLACRGFILPQARIEGVVLEDLLSGERFEVAADAVINASGPWAEDVLNLTGGPKPGQLKLDAGSHLIVRNFFGRPIEAGFFLEMKDGRLVFVLPEGENLLIGTTSEGERADKDNVSPLPEFNRYLLAEVNSLFPKARLSAADVIWSFSAQRPIFDQPRAKNADTMSRQHVVTISPQGLITVYGGKITPALLIGEEIARIAARQMGIECSAVDLSAPLVGGEINDYPRYLDEEGSRLAAQYSAGTDLVKHLISKYGTRAEAILMLTREDPALLKPLSAGSPAIGAQAAYAVGQEMALTVEAVLARRLRLDRERGNGLPALPGVIDIMRRYFGWQAEEAEAQAEAYQQYVQRGRIDF